MAAYNLDDRLQENQNVWKEYSEKITIEGVIRTLFILALLIIVIGYINQHGATLSFSNVISDFYANASSELLSIVITVAILQRLNSRQADKQELMRLKALLASNESVVAKFGVSELRARGWLQDGSLQGVSLGSANLSGAFLWQANLSRAKFWGANFSGADLRATNLSRIELPFTTLKNTNFSGANLSQADLRIADLSESDLSNVNLSGAFLLRANLSHARLWDANLSGADLREVNLSGANLRGAILTGSKLWRTSFMNANLSDADLRGVDLNEVVLRGANLEGALWSKDTILPDGKNWSEQINMRMFT